MKKVILLFFLLFKICCVFAEDAEKNQEAETEITQFIEQNEVITQGGDPAIGVDSILAGIHKDEPWSTIPIEGTHLTPLTLNNAVWGALKSNRVIEQLRLEWNVGIRKVMSAFGNFEPDLVASYTRSEVNRENSTLESLETLGSRFFSSQSNDFNGGLAGKLISGGDYNIGLTLNESKGNLISGFDYKSFAGISLKQPLLKGAWFGAPLSDIKAAKRDRSIAFHTYRKQIMKTISDTEMAYWNLVFAQEEYRIGEESVAISQKLVDDCEERVKAGKMSNLDLLEAQAGLADSQSRLADAEQKLLDVMRQLKILISDDKMDRSWFVATEKLEHSVSEYETKIKDKRFQILNELDIIQPDIAIERERLEKERVLLNYQKDQRLVELNAKGSYGVNGFGKSYNESFDKLEFDKTPAWSIGLEMKVPLFAGVTERNELAAAKMKTEAANQRLKETYQELRFTIEALLLRIEALGKRLESARKVVEFRKKRLDTELIRFKEGQSNSRLIFEIQKDYSDARQNEMQVILKYKQALLELVFYRGSILDSYGLEMIVDDKVFLKGSNP